MTLEQASGVLIHITCSVKVKEKLLVRTRSYIPEPKRGEEEIQARRYEIDNHPVRRKCFYKIIGFQYYQMKNFNFQKYHWDDKNCVYIQERGYRMCLHLDPQFNSNKMYFFLKKIEV